MNRVLLVCLFLLLTLPVLGMAQVKIGVLSRSGSTSCLNRWSALGDYLAEQLDERVYVLPLDFDAVEQVVQDGKIDFLLANPFFFVTARQKFKARAIATLLVARQDKSLQQFAGVVFVRKDSRSEQISDIRRRSFMAVDFSSFGGYLMAYKLLLDNDIDPRKDPSSLVEGITHENVVRAVAKGLIEVGTVRTGVLEGMAEDGEIELTEFRILHQVDDAFPFVHSTRLYPEWPMAALAHVTDNQARAMQKALFGLQASEPAARQAGIVGWQPAVSYDPVRAVIRIIQDYP